MQVRSKKVGAWRGHTPRKATAWRGMTFIELIVVLGIFGAIASTVLFNYRDFSENVNLKNLAQNIALQVKRAQTDAISGKLPQLSMNQGGGVPIGWKPSFGIAFNIEDTGSDVDNKRFFYYFNKGLQTDSDYYEDMNDFEGSSYISPCGSQPESECLEEIQITGGEFVDLICFGFETIEQNDDCSSDGTQSDRAYISFTRPRSNASIRMTGTDDPADNVYIRISSPRGAHKYISIWESGYIAIQ